MRELDLFELEKSNVMTTNEVLQRVLPLITKENVYTLLGDMSDDDKKKQYKKLRTYKSRILEGTAKEKTLSEVFALFGYKPITTIWRKD